MVAVHFVILYFICFCHSTCFETIVLIYLIFLKYACNLINIIDGPIVNYSVAFFK